MLPFELDVWPHVCIHVEFASENEFKANHTCLILRHVLKLFVFACVNVNMQHEQGFYKSKIEWEGGGGTICYAVHCIIVHLYLMHDL